MPAQRTILRDVCRITHHNEEAYVGALAVVLAIRGVLSGTWSPPDNLLSLVVQSLPGCAVRERLRMLSQVPREVPVAELGERFGSSGYVVESVPLALFAAQAVGSGGIEGVVRTAIEAGGDTDTVASIAGQVAGTWLGAEAKKR